MSSDLNKTLPPDKVEAENLYNLVLTNVIYPLVGKRVTWGRDLTKAGMKLFGKNYTGTFPADRIPQLGKQVTSANISEKSPLYAIANLDSSDEPGSHWIALAYDVATKKIWVYDSFGRKTSDIMPMLAKQFGKKNLLMSENDSEQHIAQDDCGARSLAFLYIFDRYGSSYAKWI